MTTTDVRLNHRWIDTQSRRVGAEHNSQPDHQLLSAEGQGTAVVGLGNSPRSDGHTGTAPHGTFVDRSRSDAGTDSQKVPAAQEQCAAGPVLFDPFLTVLAAQVEDIEKARIASENRLRQLTRTEPDEDGVVRGFGLDAALPEVKRVTALVDGLKKVEHETGLALNRALRAHPLGAWCKRTVGVGERQLARLLGVIGDPYWNTLHDRPRLVSELWAYCGLHVIRTGGQRAAAGQTTSAAGPDLSRRVGHGRADSQCANANSVNSRADHRSIDVHIVNVDSGRAGGAADASQRDVNPQGNDAGVAPRRHKGQRANWSTEAKMRAYLIAESCIKQRASPYRDVYDKGRAKYALAVHATDCAPCRSKAGEELRLGHQHARAMRLVMKAVLRDLWVESKRIHDQEFGDTNDVPVQRA